MKISGDLKREIIRNVQDGAVAVMNAKIKIPDDGRRFEEWNEEDKRLYHLIDEVQREILKRVRKTLEVD
jgi:hypothetical protein